MISHWYATITIWQNGIIIIIIIIIIIKTSNIGPSGKRKNKIIYKLLSQPHNFTRATKTKKNSEKQLTNRLTAPLNPSNIPV